MPNDEKYRASWAVRQIRLLVEEIGLDVSDAEVIVRQVLDAAPEGADLDMFLPARGGEGMGSDITPSDVARARAAWYADDTIPPAFKRLLDAVKASHG